LTRKETKETIEAAEETTISYILYDDLLNWQNKSRVKILIFRNIKDFDS
jgi:hypothetical protein